MKHKKKTPASPEERRARMRAASARWRSRPENKAYGVALNRAVRFRNKMTILMHYGGVCNCCGYDRHEGLVIDHVEGGGSKHRRSLGSGSDALYRWIIANGFPPAYQVLCASCNTIKGTKSACFCGVRTHTTPKDP